MLHRSAPAALAAGLLLFAACDSSGPNFTTPTPPAPPAPPAPVFDPLTADFDTVDVDYAFVQPLLEARDVFPSIGAADDGYSWASLFQAAEGESIIPFNADASLLIRLAESDLGEAETAPYAVQSLDADEVRYLRRWIEAGARSADGSIPYADAEKLLYVCNQLAGRVSIIDAERLRTIRMVDLPDHGFVGGMMGAAPHDVAVAPDGDSWYLTMIFEDATARFSTSLTMDPSDDAYLLATSEPAEAGAGAFTKPGMIEVADDGPVVVGRSFSDLSGSQSIATMDPQTLAFTEIPLPYTRPHAVGAVPGGRYVLSASLAEAQQAALIDLEADGGPEITALAPLTTAPTALVQFAVAPDAASAVLTSQLTSEIILLDLDLAGGSVSQAGVVGVGQQPWHPIYSPDGSRVYVPNRQSNSVSFVDPAAGTVTRTVTDPRFSQPHGATISDDGRTLFVSHRNTESELGAQGMRYTPRYALGPNTATALVTAIDTETGAVVAAIETGAWASGMAYYAGDQSAD